MCTFVRYQQVLDKFRLCEYDSVIKVIRTAKLRQDHVYTQIADRLRGTEKDSVCSVTAADLYCYKNCYRSYVRHLEKPKIKSEECESTCTMKNSLFQRAIPYIDKILENGDCCTMSNITNFTSSLLEEGEVLKSKLRNRDMKQFLGSNYGDTVTITSNAKAYESDIFYSSQITPGDLLTKLKNQDIMREAGLQLRKDLKVVDFGLEDSFCDSNDLKESWERTRMPDSMLTFFSALYNIPKHKLFRSKAKEFSDMINVGEEYESGFDKEHDENDGTDYRNSPVQEEPVEKKEHDTWVSNIQSTRLHCLFQIMHYNLTGGKQKVPMHMMLAHNVYARDRSKIILTIFNRAMVCAGYKTIRKSRSLLASFAINLAKNGEVPIPSNLTTDDFTEGMLDNSNYLDKASLSGTEMKNYSSAALVQDATRSKPARKPPVSQTGLKVSEPLLVNKLPCQKVPNHYKPCNKPSLPNDMILVPENRSHTELDMDGAKKIAKEREFLIGLIRNGIGSENPQVWAAVHALVSSAEVPLMRVGFLPVVPEPITLRPVVRHCLTNFQSVCRQLTQDVIPIWADEGVFCIVADIFLHEPDTFKDIFPCMGPFHWCRILLRCAGKLLRGTGIDDALVECGIFGPIVIDTVLNGSHYVRALTGMLVVEDVVMKMAWKAFWYYKSKDNYPILTEILELSKKLHKKERCPKLFDSLLVKVNTLHVDFEKFMKEAEEKSELCEYLGLWLKIVAVIKNNVASEREGNWNLHVAVTGDSIPIFAEFDCIKYLKSGSWYYERIKALEFTHPDIFRRFMLGQWAVRENPGWFISVGADMRHEQSGQRVSKGPGGHFVVGATRKVSVVSEFELIYHEVGAICSILNIVTSNESLQHMECQLQHTFSPGRRVTVNRSVARLLEFTLKHQNPYIITVAVPVLLHNLYTRVAVDKEVAHRLLKCLDNGEKSWQEMRNQRFVQKSVKLFAPVTLRKLPKFNHQPKSIEKPEVKEKTEVSPKELAQGYRDVELARERDMKIEVIVSCDVLSVSPLFIGDLPSRPTKAKIMEEIEPRITNIKYMADWEKETCLKTAVMIDIMSKLRQLPFTGNESIGKFLNSMVKSSLNISHMIHSSHFLHDSYIQQSLKDSERLRRSDGIEGLDIIGMAADTPVPIIPEKFWSSEKNKVMIQLLLRNIISCNEYNAENMIMSSMIYEEEMLPSKLFTGEEIPELNNWLEEADSKVIVHVEYAVRVQKCLRVIVLSNDTDTFIFLLYYTEYFKRIGLKELWLQYGTGENRRMIPLHEAHTNIGTAFSKAILKAYILTGNDSISKVGTKHSAMTCDPVQYLTNFGEEAVLSEQDFALAERFLVRVWAGVRSKTTAETFDQLRLENFVNGSSLESLPPTSSVINGHLKRGFFLVKQACNLLKNPNNSDDPLEHGWVERFGMLLPDKNLKSLPEFVLKICKCQKSCESKNCRCKAEGVKCTIYCHGKTISKQCKNQKDGYYESNMKINPEETN